MNNLQERVRQFHMMHLPGQPLGMHMGTSYLVNDLANRIAALEAQVAATAFDLLSRNETVCTVDDADAEIERLFTALRTALAAYRAAKGE